MDINHIIDGLGGTTAVARHFDREPSVVHGWRKKGSVAHWWVSDIVKLAKSRGFPLVAADVPVTPKKVGRAVESVAA